MERNTRPASGTTLKVLLAISATSLLFTSSTTYLFMTGRLTIVPPQQQAAGDYLEEIVTSRKGR